MDGPRFAVTSSKDSLTRRRGEPRYGRFSCTTPWQRLFKMSNRTSFRVLSLLALLAVLSRNFASALLFHQLHIGNEGPTVERLEQCRLHLRSLIQVKFAHALFVRLAWHDSGTFDKVNTMLLCCLKYTLQSLYPNWPRCGGANGSIRFGLETNHDANKGLHAAVLLLEKVKFKFPEISYADIYQMASATAIQVITRSSNFTPLSL